jgi:putative ABC transport system permease protein
VKPLDPTIYLVVSGLLILVAAISCFVPARRATRVNPMVALRTE